MAEVRVGPHEAERRRVRLGNNQTRDVRSNPVGPCETPDCEAGDQDSEHNDARNRHWPLPDPKRQRHGVLGLGLDGYLERALHRQTHVADVTNALPWILLEAAAKERAQDRWHAIRERGPVGSRSMTRAKVSETSSPTWTDYGGVAMSAR